MSSQTNLRADSPHPLPHPAGYHENLIPDLDQHPDATAILSLQRALAHAWSEDTSVDALGWLDRLDAGMRDTSGTAYGQCAATALVVLDYLGGELLRTVATTPTVDTSSTDGAVTEAAITSHYFNRLPDGTLLDLTRCQFPRTTTFTDAEPRDRDYVHDGGSTARRYQAIADHIDGAVTTSRHATA